MVMVNRSTMYNVQEYNLAWLDDIVWAYSLLRARERKRTQFPVMSRVVDTWTISQRQQMLH